MPLDWETIASISFGGAITVLTSLSAVAFKEWVDRRRERRTEDAELRAAARRAWAEIRHGCTYFAISAFNGQWATTGAAVATVLTDEDARLLSRDAGVWQDVYETLHAFALALDARASSPDQTIPENARPLVFAAVSISLQTARALYVLGGFEGRPAADDADFLRELFGDKADEFIALCNDMGTEE